MLNLRKLSGPVDSELHSGADRLSKFTLPGFNITVNMIGNMGEPLDHGPSDNEEDDMEDSASGVMPSFLTVT